MSFDLAYFLKINIAIALFYAFYRLFFYKDTFFVWRRTALLSFLVVALLYPLLNIQQWISGQEPMVAMADIYATMILPEFEVAPSTAINWKHLILSASGYIYAGVVLLLLFRFCVQLFGIIRLAFRSSTQTIHHVKVHLLDKSQRPFSFFNRIFIHPDAHTGDELKEILAHEQTHVRQWHSVDVVFTELMCIACWFNPFIWLMKREVRNNLEFLADRNVLEKGHDCKTYQYHLLGLTNEKKVATLYNSFNVLPLKIRISMMNKKRTKRIGRTKYAIFLPLAALLLIVSNIEAIARSTEKDIDRSDATTALVADSLKNGVYEMVEQMPQYPEGTDALLKFVSTNIKYPVNAQQKGIEGTVIVQFIIDETGKVTSPKVLRSADPELDAEAMRVVQAMPRWTPGKQNGKDVSVYYTLPLVFKVQGKTKQAENNPSPKVNKDGVYQMVEVMPLYPGGTDALMEYFSTNIKYPQSAQDKKLEGTVIVQFIVDETGKVTSPKIVRSLDPEMDAEAMRVVQAMPRWTPGKQKGKDVAVFYTLPIVYKLKGEAKAASAK